MLDQLQRQGPALSWKTGNDTMEGNGSDLHQDKARRFRDAALPYLDDVYTLARYLLRKVKGLIAARPTTHVRYRGHTGKHMLVLSFTGFDPNETFRGEFRSHNTSRPWK